MKNKKEINKERIISGGVHLNDITVLDVSHDLKYLKINKDTFTVPTEVSVFLLEDGLIEDNIIYRGLYERSTEGRSKEDIIELLNEYEAGDDFILAKGDEANEFIARWYEDDNVEVPNCFNKKVNVIGRKAKGTFIESESEVTIEGKTYSYGVWSRDGHELEKAKDKNMAIAWLQAIHDIYIDRRELDFILKTAGVNWLNGLSQISMFSRASRAVASERLTQAAKSLESEPSHIQASVHYSI